MENEKNFDQNSVYSKRVKAGKRRTYFFDVRTTKSNDYFITITESKKRFNADGYDRHKIFIYKEDFKKFIESMQETIDHVKTELLPDFDFDAVPDYESHEQSEATSTSSEEEVPTQTQTSSITNPANDEEVDKWD
ncbi:MAG: DUF3276 family protein [Sphingobacteriales bacterium]|nr:MAG: DUF3276 family protein [Sphingobacteriales bacterium]